MQVYRYLPIFLSRNLYSVLLYFFLFVNYDDYKIVSEGELRRQCFLQKIKKIRTVNDINKISILLVDIDKISILLVDIDKISIPLDDIEMLFLSFEVIDIKHYT
ncbi:hypothetical protein BpHYR1_000470 [Brachionus plicatilis]|uniref:Uncharacterized protein n=1 Tax=Brachionus plicatilis TaxID=10195 RepID=A0A3M7RMK7_BRAPC|nr:hypothetical protein BpHYR1_000470 [Brachionus plicatilis]